MTKEEKIQRIIELQKQKKAIEEEEKQLKSEIIDELEDKQTMFWYLISKLYRPTYSIKEWVDQLQLANDYPEFIKMDAGKLYKVLDGVDLYIEKSESVSLTFKEQKKKEDKKETNYEF